MQVRACTSNLSAALAAGLVDVLAILRRRQPIGHVAVV